MNCPRRAETLVLHHPTNARSVTGSIQNHVPAMPNQLNVPFETASPAAAASVTI